MVGQETKTIDNNIFIFIGLQQLFPFEVGSGKKLGPFCYDRFHKMAAKVDLTGKIELGEKARINDKNNGCK